MIALASRPCGFCARSALWRERVRLMAQLASSVARINSASSMSTNAEAQNKQLRPFDRPEADL